MAAMLAVVAFACGAAAGEIVVGLGGEIDRDDLLPDTPALSLDYWSDPVTTIGSVDVRLGLGAEATADHDVWAGVGPVATLPIGDSDARVEGSVMAGAFGHGDGRDLGGPLVFRSRIGVSLPVREHTRLGLAFEHKSNAGVRGDNPGVETLFVSVGFAY